jgi:putative phosphoesterase
MLKIGVISDTHNFLDPKVAKLFAKVDHILHGGDVGMHWLILELQLIAPVTAVFGNTDEAALRLRETEVVELKKRKFLVHHIVNPQSLGDAIKARIADERPNVVVFGHTHKPFCETIGGTLFFNPGYAGKPRFGMERSVAILHCDAKKVRPEFLAL